jgi:hypothetical protein
MADDRPQVLFITGWRVPLPRVRYEDFAAEPARRFDEVAAWAGVEQRTRPFVDANTVSLSPTHTAMGNPNRVTRGAVQVLPDMAWRTELPEREKSVVTAITGPLLLRYGYPVKPKR